MCSRTNIPASLNLIRRKNIRNIPFPFVWIVCGNIARLPSNHYSFPALSAVLWHEGDELLHCAVWCVSGPWRSVATHLESGPGLPTGETKIHEHRWADGACGCKVWLKAREAAGVLELLRE